MTIIVNKSTLKRGDGSPDQALPASLDSAPAGLEAVLEYNGIYLNSKGVVDKYRITNIDGLHDADIRDARENNPSSHGETAFTSYYGGRTISLTGRIEAHNVAKLRAMQQALRTAFSSLEELPLYFRMSNSMYDHYIECRKSSPIAMAETQQNANNFYRDFVITLRASDPRFKSVQENSVVIRPNVVGNPAFYADLSQWTSFSTGATGLSFTRSTDWTPWGVASGKVTGTSNAGTGQIGIYHNTADVVPGEVYTLSFTGNIINNASTGNGFFGQIGWFNSSDSQIGVYESTLKYSGHATTGIVGIHHVTAPAPVGTKYARVIIKCETTTNPDYMEFLVGNVMVRRGEFVTPGVYEIENNGSFESEPRIRAYGALSTIGLSNSTSGKQLVFESDADVGSGEWIEADIARRTMQDNTGTNRFSELAIASDWMTLQPGINQITPDLRTTGHDTESRIELYYRDAWI